MDFTPTETEREIARLAVRVLQGARPVNVGAPAAAGPGETYDRALWKELSQALLSLALPGWLDGDELGVAGTAVLLTEIGRRAAAVPALATVMTGVLPVVRWGDRGLQQTLLAGVATGDTVLTAALREPSDPMPARPVTTASLAGGAGQAWGGRHCLRTQGGRAVLRGGQLGAGPGQRRRGRQRGGDREPGRGRGYRDAHAQLRWRA